MLAAIVDIKKYQLLHTEELPDDHSCQKQHSLGRPTGLGSSRFSWY